jgi:S-adenosyl-L-methionine hydrolase (adenosine-forming)
VSTEQIVTFTTDFGFHDHFVGTMKGVVISIAPGATLVDICHDVNSYDVVDGALTIAQAYRYFPAGTVHVAVVDPGVGSARRPILAHTGREIFVCPDNGLLSFVLEREPNASVRHITNDRYFLHPVSNTFHGRDIFAPTAAHIAAGVPLEHFGPEIKDYVKLQVGTPQLVGNALRGEVLKIDKFGNVVTNITPLDLDNSLGPGQRFIVKIGNAIVSDLRTSYSDSQTGRLFSIFGSMGLLEVVVNRGSAAEQLRVRRGASVEIESA